MTMTKGPVPETEHVIVKSVAGKNRYVIGYYHCKCGKRFDTFHQWRSHKTIERRKRREMLSDR